MNTPAAVPATLPMIDGHVHIFSPNAGEPDYDPLASFTLGGDDPGFLESADAPPTPADLVRLAGQAEQTMVFRYAVEALSGLLGCEPTAAAVREARRDATRDYDAYLRRLYAEMNLEAMLVDTGYPPGASAEFMESRTGIRSRAIHRIESTIAASWDGSETLEALETSLLDWMQHGARHEAVAGFKSIIAYRTGLGVAEVTRAEARRAYDRLKKSSQAQGLLKLIKVPAPLFADVKQVRDFLLWRALETSIDLGLPFQVHAGLGDSDLDIEQADPGLLATVMRDRRLRRVQMVLLHTAYPFHEKAAYLANVFPNVYVDLSLASPFLVGGGARVLRSMLELAPFTKLTAGTDACGSPELHWVGIRLARASLEAAIAEGVSWSARPESHADVIRRLVLRDNAARLYELGATGKE